MSEDDDWKDWKANYVLDVRLFVDGATHEEKCSAVSTRVNLGPFRHELSPGDVQEILYAAKMQYGKIMRRSRQKGQGEAA